MHLCFKWVNLVGNSTAATPDVWWWVSKKGTNDGPNVSRAKREILYSIRADFHLQILLFYLN